MVRALQLDGRAPVAQLARQLGVPRSTVQERLNRLLERGIITRFVPILDHSLLGRPVLVHILATFLPGTDVSQRQVAKRALEIPGVEEVHLISGDWDILMKVRGASMEEIGDLVVDRIRSVPGIGRTLTCANFHTESHTT